MMPNHPHHNHPHPNHPHPNHPHPNHPHSGLIVIRGAMAPENAIGWRRGRKGNL
jgi:hypothetical protein